jgi:23S rRNA (cytidine1920-2'-O)/16S rRNA (cytidine1409-2'-O)-methyltransferase
MRADKYLVAHGHFDTRARAQAAIAAGLVQVDGRVLTKPSQEIADGAAVIAVPPYSWVSRAALKLVAALDAFGFDPAQRTCLDVGASTGGFTEVLLARGARHVTAIDVGHGQFADKLAADPRVTLREGTNAKALTAADLPRAPEAVVCDVSFISLTKALPPALDLAAPGAWLAALIKPQFEVGRVRLGKGGIVRDAGLHAEVRARIADWLERDRGWRIAGEAESPIVGGDGNREFLIGAVKP